MASITQFLSNRANPASDNIVLAPATIHPDPSDAAILQPDEFKIQGKQYVRCSSLAKAPKSTKKRTSVVWKYGEDIQYKQDGKKFWYCYLCEKQQKQQELPSIGNGNCTSLDHLELKHNVDRNTGEVKAQARSREEGQLSITEANSMKTLVYARRLDKFKDLLIRWVVYCHIAIFQIENGYFRELLFYLFPPLANLLPKARATLRRWIMEACAQRLTMWPKHRRRHLFRCVAIRRRSGTHRRALEKAWCYRQTPQYCQVYQG